MFRTFTASLTVTVNVPIAYKFCPSSGIIFLSSTDYITDKVASQKS